METSLLFKFENIATGCLYIALQKELLVSILTGLTLYWNRKRYTREPCDESTDEYCFEQLWRHFWLWNTYPGTILTNQKMDTVWTSNFEDSGYGEHLHENHSRNQQMDTVWTNNFGNNSFGVWADTRERFDESNDGHCLNQQYLDNRFGEHLHGNHMRHQQKLTVWTSNCGDNRFGFGEATQELFDLSTDEHWLNQQFCRQQLWLWSSSTGLQFLIQIFNFMTQTSIAKVVEWPAKCWYSLFQGEKWTVTYKERLSNGYDAQERG